MYCSVIHQIIFVIIFTTLTQLVYSDNDDTLPRTISKDHVNHRWSPETVVKRNETHKIPLYIIVRMFAFGIHPSDDNNNEQEKPADTNLPFNEPLLPLKKDSNCCEDEELQKNNRISLLPLMVRMLLERITERADMIKKSNGYKIKHESNRKKLLENKKYNFYEHIKDFINTNDNNDKIEKLMVIILFILSFAVFLLSIFLINRRLRNTHKKFNILRVNSTVTSGKINHEEARKLLPSA